MSTRSSENANPRAASALTAAVAHALAQFATHAQSLSPAPQNAPQCPTLPDENTNAQNEPTLPTLPTPVVRYAEQPDPSRIPPTKTDRRNLQNEPIKFRQMPENSP